MEKIEAIIISILLVMLIFCFFYRKKMSSGDGFNADGVEVRLKQIDKTEPTIENEGEALLVPDSMSYAYRMDKPHVMYSIKDGPKPPPLGEIYLDRTADYVAF